MRHWISYTRTVSWKNVPNAGVNVMCNTSAFIPNSLTFIIVIAVPSELQQDLTCPRLQNIFQIRGFWELSQAIKPIYKGREQECANFHVLTSR